MNKDKDPKLRPHILVEVSRTEHEIARMDGKIGANYHNSRGKTMTNQWHQMAVDKGWHDNDEMGPDGTPSARQRLAWVALILTEFGEYWDDECAGYAWGIQDTGKPVGYMSEIVDIWIRCADTLGACGESIEPNESDRSGSGIDAKSRNRILAHAAEFTRTGAHANYARALRLLMRNCENFNTRLSPVSFQAALHEKTAYNATRSHRHGGKLA